MGHKLQSFQGGFVSFDRTAPWRIEHATPSLFWSERYSTSFLQHCARRIHLILTKSTIYSIFSVLHASDRRVERFDQSIANAAIAEWRRCRLNARVRVSGAHFEHQVYKFSYFVIYLPKVIKLIES